MMWKIEEALSYFKQQGAPGDQTALTGLLREIQQEHQGQIPSAVLPQIAAFYSIQETYLRAVIRRIPSLHLENQHCLEICCGAVCGKCSSLTAFAEQICRKYPGKFTLKYTGCMRMCGKGPNIKWNGKIYHQADEALIRRLVLGVAGDRSLPHP